MTDHEIALLLRAAAEMVRMQSDLLLLGLGQTPPQPGGLASDRNRVSMLVTEIAMAARERELR